MIQESVKRKALAKQELTKAIARFVKRQVLVAEVIKDLGLSSDDMARYGAFAWGGPPDRNLFSIQQQAIESAHPDDIAYFYNARRASQRKLPRKGTWYDVYNQSWEYYLHGGGCMIVNKETEEVLDWDCPNILAFDPFFFQPHLEWQLKQQLYRNEFVQFRLWLGNRNIRVIQELLEELQADGILTQEWTLTDQHAQ